MLKGIILHASAFCYGFNMVIHYTSSDVCFVSFVVADVLLWKRWHVSLGIIVVATVAWVLFEWTSLPFLTICSDVLLILIVLLFLHANYASLRNKYECSIPCILFFIIFNISTMSFVSFSSKADNHQHYLN